MFYKLEALRGIAAICVVFFHSPFMLGDAPLSFFANSYLFVDFFFVLSGFVITHAYQSRIAGGFSLRDYGLLRLGRLYPLHLLTLAAWLPLLGINLVLFQHGIGPANPFELNTATSFVSNLLLVQSLGVHDYLAWNVPSWSISCEMAAYLVFFLLLRSLDRQRGFLLPLVIIAASYLLLFRVAEGHLDLTYDYGFFRCLGAFYIGVLIYRLKLARPTQSERWQVLQLPLALGVPMLLSQATGNEPVIAITIISFGLAVMAFSAQGGGLISRWLETPLALTLGRWSYSIYMVHAFSVFVWTNAVGFFFPLDQGMGWMSLPANAAYLSSVLVTAWLAHRYVEMPAQQWVKKRVCRQHLPSPDSKMPPNQTSALPERT